MENCLFIGQQLPFDQASVTIEKLTGQVLTGKQLERWCHYYGEGLEGLPPQMLEAAPEGQVSYGMVDGSFILTREEGWKETKLARFFHSGAVLPENQGRNFIRGSRYVACLGKVGKLKEKVRGICPKDIDMVWIGDGARWIWQWLDEEYPGHAQVLDYYHASEKLHQFAHKAIVNEVERKKWTKGQESLLLEGKAEEVVANVKLLITKGEARSLQVSLVKYYTENGHRMRYGEYRAKGWLIGSGPIESAHRTVVQQRLKCSGQRWTFKGAQQMLNLRVAEKSGQWGKVRQLLAA